MGPRWCLVTVLLAAGCIEPDLVVCADGRACATGQVCDDVHLTCVTRDQLSSCDGQADLTACEAGPVVGSCFGGVCLRPGCGNRAVEPDEQCDDGNRIDGDGCSADCGSTERCDNGVLDPGEACDDGNFVSHDGCSSQCAIETETWSLAPLLVGPDVDNVNRSAFDEARRRLVALYGELTWEWDGSQWRVVAARPTPSFELGMMAYDPQHGVVTAFGHDTLAATADVFVVAQWNGIKWTVISTKAPPLFDPGYAVYDRTNKRFVLGIEGANFAYTPQDTSWQTLQPPPFTDARAVASYDEARERIVVLSATTADTTWEYVGTQWIPIVAAIATKQRWGMAYDRAHARVTIVGGQDNAMAYSGGMWTWSGSQWTSVGPVVSPRASPAMWFDPADNALYVWGGRASPANVLDIQRTIGTAATDVTPVMPRRTGALAYDPAIDMLVLFEPAGGPVWGFRTAWQQLAPSSPLDVVRAEFDPGRGAIIAFDGNTTAAFHAGWSALAVTGIGSSPHAMTYDHARRRLVAITASGTYALGAAAQSWTRIGDPRPGNSLAVERTSDQLVAYHTVRPIDGVWRMSASGTWDFQFSFGFTSQVVAAPERGSVLVVSNTPRIWELRGDETRAGGERPLLATPFAGAIENLSRGRFAVTAPSGASIALVFRQLTSTTPDETCSGGADADGDGAAGCADPDCWQTCFPACPLATSACP